MLLIAFWSSASRQTSAARWELCPYPYILSMSALRAVAQPSQPVSRRNQPSGPGQHVLCCANINVETRYDVGTASQRQTCRLATRPKLLMGVEPMTSSLPRTRSTTELQQRLARATAQASLVGCSHGPTRGNPAGRQGEHTKESCANLASATCYVLGRPQPPLPKWIR